MPTPNDDGYAAEVIRTVSELTRKLEQYQRAGDDARKQLQETVEGNVVQMRKDFWDTTIAIQLDATQHRDEHIAERKERAADLMVRVRRTSVVDIWMGALTLLGVINLILIVYIVSQGR